MANSGYISKNIDSEQLRFLNLLEESEIQYFRISEIEKRLQTNFKNINEVVENLEHKKLLKRIERGKYVRKTFSNINSLACFVSGNGAIGYWSALHYHGLTDRFPNIVFVKKTGRKKDTEIDRVKIRYISVKDTKMIGLQKDGYGENSFGLPTQN
jgi:predicted transcriptional regulator of viral defense system